ncbi:hypothetical protein FEZ32_04215 [Acidipropionibacterium jensenii]|uniref:hypothetical protein n=1 Tax=Acidipropionibacterium jensenii TaxID=1749 RepID=UPI00110A1869|nr:hypothetical protein [Acidipropionibacterium jensenii]QCV87682.1 hypothetical protein FEZ32_04215 [Acidipropionibacterium jensenii]
MNLLPGTDIEPLTIPNSTLNESEPTNAMNVSQWPTIHVMSITTREAEYAKEKFMRNRLNQECGFTITFTVIHLPLTAAVNTHH